jgi:hypothetical protein
VPGTDESDRLYHTIVHGKFSFRLPIGTRDQVRTLGLLEHCAFQGRNE